MFRVIAGDFNWTRLMISRLFGRILNSFILLIKSVLILARFLVFYGFACSNSRILLNTSCKSVP